MISSATTCIDQDQEHSVVSLEDFATAKRQNAKKHPKCVTCNLPTHILTEVEDARELQENGEPKYTYRTIHDWLVTLEIDIPATTLSNHFKVDHHLGK